MDVVRAEFKESLNLSYVDLFEGFDTIHALTYSASARQIENVLRLVPEGEVIIGSPSQVRKDLAMLFAEQEYNLNFILTTPFLQQKLNDETFRIYQAEGSHGKLYLLSSKDGRRRVITSSANCSMQAWDESQYENFVYMDEPEAYDHYMECYEAIRDTASMRITKKMKPIKADGSNIKELPTIKRVVEANHAVVITNAEPHENVTWRYDVSADMQEKWEKILAKEKIKRDDKGHPILTAKNITKIAGTLRKVSKEAQKDIPKTPKFVLDYSSYGAAFDDVKWDMEPPMEDVRRDIHNMMAYVRGAEKFTGDTQELKKIYWQILIYMFVSPFIAKFRMAYYPFAPINSVGRYFPMFMVIRGPRNGGKSSIVKTGRLLMFGRDLGSADVQYLVQTRFPALAETVKGVPVLFEDVDSRRTQYFGPVVKNEGALLMQGIDDHGTFILTSNTMNNITPDIKKRTLVFQINNKLTENTAFYEDSRIKNLQNSLGNAFYRFYLKRSFPILANFCDYIQSEALQDSGKGPDVFQIASNFFIDAIRDAGVEIPPELRIFTWEDYMGDGVKSEEAVRELRDAFYMSPDMFRVDERKDSLIITFNSSFKASQLQSLQDELPPETEPKVIGQTMRVKLSAIKSYAGIDFQKHNGFFSRVRDLVRGD